MKYYHLKSILDSQKQYIAISEESSSFFVAGDRSTPYVEPTFEKVIFNEERPTILLVSAVGATGKSALAHELSRSLKIPILDLALHKPVGDNTLTGILTRSYDIKDISSVFQGLANGSHGIIIDGIDEGRSKTTEKGFEAFLDDVAELSQSSKSVTFLLLGRTQILEDCWVYLNEKGVSTGLLTISPFSLESAREYINLFTEGVDSRHVNQYAEARDFIIDKLAKAFNSEAHETEFMSFMGYPPVLDAISTLLIEERNYHKLLENIKNTEGNNVEVTLLYRISTYILDREREEKALPNIIIPLLDGVPSEIRTPIIKNAYSQEEQCIRLIAHCLGKPLKLATISDNTLNDKYEDALPTWLQEHPFLKGREFRNAVFEAVVLATLMAGRSFSNHDLVKEYTSSHKYSYHLVYMLDKVMRDTPIPFDFIGELIAAAMEFRSVHSIVELHLLGPNYKELEESEWESVDITVDIEVRLGQDRRLLREFQFFSEIEPQKTIRLKSHLGGTFISLPCRLVLGGDEIELIAPVEISASEINIEAKTIVLRRLPSDDAEREIILEAGRLSGHAESIIRNNLSLTVSLESLDGVSYPIIQYTTKTTAPPSDPLLRQKYFRLRRILLEFRSHSKGALAKYKHKIEHNRVLKNEIGRAVLNKLIADDVLRLKGEMYFLDPTSLNAHLGINWHDLRAGKMPETLMNYLREV